MQEIMFNEPLSPLSFTAGLAILTNACAIMQNGATTRYNLAITQWRDFCASVAAQDGRLSREYLDPEMVVVIADRRVRLQLVGMALLNAAFALFAVTSVLGLGGAFLVQIGSLPPHSLGLGMVIAGGISLLLLLASTVTFFLENACGRALLRLHRPGREDIPSPNTIGGFALRLLGLPRAPAS